MWIKPLSNLYLKIKNYITSAIHIQYVLALAVCRISFLQQLFFKSINIIKQPHKLTKLQLHVFKYQFFQVR